MATTLNFAPPAEQAEQLKRAQAAGDLNYAPPVELSEKLNRTKEWTRQVLDSLGVSRDARGTGADALTIPLDEPLQPRQRKIVFSRVNDSDHEDVPVAIKKPVRRMSSRDSLRRRDAILHGKEGSRQRRRWENDRLMHVPNAQPPLPSDWEVRPTHTVHYNLPYHLAQYWDRGMREMINERRAAEAVHRREQLVAQQSGTQAPQKKKAKSPKKGKSPKKAGSSGSSGSSGSASPSPTFGLVTRDLRVAVKKSETIKLWVRTLEEPVRQYVFAAEAARRALESDSAVTDASSSVGGDDNGDDDHSVIHSVSAISDTYAVSDQDDDDLVFVGRRTLVEKQAQASWRRAHREVNHQPVDSGILFDSLGDGETGSFKRWIAHSLSDYYGLTSQSTNTDASNRVVYVCLRDEAIRAGAGPILIPRPMWEAFEAS